MGSNPVQAWIFFRPYFHYCLSSVQHCKDHLQIHFLDRSLHKWFLYIFTVIVPNIATQLNLDNRSFTSERNENLGKKMENVKIEWTRYLRWEWLCHAESFSSLVLGLIHMDNFRKLTLVSQVETLILISSTVNARSSAWETNVGLIYVSRKIRKYHGQWHFFLVT